MSHKVSLRRIALGLWVALFPLLGVLLELPVNSRALRMCIFIVGGALIVGGFTFFWQRRLVVRSLAVICLLIGTFLLLPGHPPENALILPGDMAVTKGGIHVMAYLGNNQWIGADPGAMKVTVFTTPNPTSGWFSCPMNIVRWSMLN
jgi:hypothetical protein